MKRNKDFKAPMKRQQSLVLLPFKSTTNIRGGGGGGGGGGDRYYGPKESELSF